MEEKCSRTRFVVHRLGRRGCLLVLSTLLQTAGCGTNQSAGQEEMALTLDPQQFDVSVAPPVQKLTAFLFECEGELEFLAKIEGSGANALIRMSDRTVQLPRQAADSGAKFGDEEIVFWSKGPEATLDMGGRSYACKENRSRSLVEDALLRGVDFRASGNEPPWVLELADDFIVLITDYGQTLQRFPPAEPQTDASKRVTRYESSEGDHRLIIELVAEPCLDSMSGEQYEASVKVMLDDQAFSGCGSSTQ